MGDGLVGGWMDSWMVDGWVANTWREKNEDKPLTSLFQRVGRKDRNKKNERRKTVILAESVFRVIIKD